MIVKNQHLEFIINYKIILDSKDIAAGTIKAANSIASLKSKRSGRIKVYEDNFHKYYYSYNISRDTIDFTVGQFLQNMDNRSVLFISRK